MKCGFIAIGLMLATVGIASCTQENKRKDRSDADDMFGRICSLAEEYTAKLSDSPDSSAWAAVCGEFEDRLDKITFSYPPDTDLLLTEGQNDTIHSLLLEYMRIRDERIHEILHPIIEMDSLTASDSVIEIVDLSAETAAMSHITGN